MDSRWIGVDFDGTLAEDMTPWPGPGKCGPPIMPMVKFVKSLLDKGFEVKIFTARVCPGWDGVEENRRLIQDFCLKHFGKVLDITCVKSPDMAALYDDRAFRVQYNQGILCPECEKAEIPE